MKRDCGLRIADCGFGGRAVSGRPSKNPKSAIRNPKFLLALLPLLLLSCGAFWQSDTDRAVELARTGQYAEAAAILEKAVAGGAAQAQVVEALYYSWIRQGEYAKARERFEAWASANGAPAVRLAAGRINRLAGNHARALTHLDAIQNHAEVGVAARFEKAQVLDETGRREEAEAIYRRLNQDYLDRRIRRASDLVHVAGAMRATEYPYDANEVLQAATKADPRNAEAFVMWGELMSEAYNDAEAVASYEDALKIDPNMPEALVGIARALVSSDPPNSAKLLEQALKTNPNLIDAHLLVATQEIESEQYDKARASIDKALAVNPQSPEAYSLLAAIDYVRGNTEGFNQNVQKVLGINPRYSDLYYLLAESCVSLRLYKQAVEFAREALRLNPRDWKTYTLLGINLVRIGEEKEGKEVLEKAYAEGPRFDPWARNTLQLMDSIDQYFDRFESPHFQIKLHKKESAALRPYVVDLLEKAYKQLTAKYGFTPEGPLTFEMYPDHADFEVRALGVTGLGALGVCFGKVFVMDSPSARAPEGEGRYTFNWGSTLWHEFAHVITLQMTDHKVPRWFSEGISVFEERKAFPGWGDDMKPPFVAAIQQKKFLPIAELNDGFTRPKYREQVGVSYYQASMVVEYIEGKWGFPAILKMLSLYKAGRATPEVFQEALKLSVGAFDEEFNKWIDARAAGVDLEKFKTLVDEGQQALAKNDLDKAIQSLSSAIEMYPEYSDEKNPYESLAEAYLKKGDKAAAIATLKKFHQYNETSYVSYIRLSELLEEANDLAGAAQSLEGAMYIRPTDIPGHEKLGSLLMRLKRYADASREYESLLALNTPDRAGALYRLAEAKLGEGKRQEARKYVLESLGIAPSFEPAQELLLKVR